MNQISGPGSGISPHSATWSVLGALRNVHAELRAGQKANGHTPLGDSAALSGRAVPEVQAGSPVAPTARRRGETEGAVDPLLTGPRPAFAKTPLEKMRSDVFLGPLDEISPLPAAAARPGAIGEDAHPPGPATAYAGLRDIEAQHRPGATLNITT